VASKKCIRRSSRKRASSRPRKLIRAWVLSDSNTKMSSSEHEGCGIQETSLIGSSRRTTIVPEQISLPRRTDARHQRSVADQKATLADEKSKDAWDQKLRADEIAAKAEADLYLARMNLVQTDWENGSIARILDLLEPYRNPPPGKPDPRGWEWYYRDRLCHWDLRTFRGHTSAVGSVAISPDGAQLASGSGDSTVRVWEAATGHQIRALHGHAATVRNVAFSPDGRWLASGSDDQTIRIWDAATGQEKHTLRGSYARFGERAASSRAWPLAPAIDFWRLRVTTERSQSGTPQAVRNCERLRAILDASCLSPSMLTAVGWFREAWTARLESGIRFVVRSYRP